MVSEKKEILKKINKLTEENSRLTEKNSWLNDMLSLMLRERKLYIERYGSSDTSYKPGLNFCPNCGADIREKEETNDKRRSD